jgi:hypothetical protein
MTNLKYRVNWLAESKPVILSMQNYFTRQSTRKFSPARFLLLRLMAILFLALGRTAWAGNFYAGTSPANVPWPGGIVPYQFTNTLTLAESNTFLDGLREWELAANVHFVPHTNQSNWILFCYNTNFLDYVSGGSYSPQIVTVSSLSRAQVCHEMGHSFGFNHENIRPDATNYIAVLTNNITDEPTNLHWFIPDITTITNGNYDYESVMHLGWDFDSTNPGVLATQQPKAPNFPRFQFRMGNYCLSPGDRAALAYLYGPPLVPLTNIVTTTADFGTNSLRAAIYYATDHPGTTIKFNIPTSDPGYSNGVFNIHLTGHLPPLVANGMVIDGSTQPGFVNIPVIFVDASQIIPETFTSDTVLVYSSSNQLRNIAFTGFDWNGVTLLYPDATNNTISGCWFGVASTGTNAAPNAYQGILIAAGAGGNIIGGTNALQRNVLSGNAQYGVFITDSNTTGNVVLGNNIGTDFFGANALANGLSGVFIGNNAGGNIIGGTNTGARNILSGNAQYGVIITSNTTANVILGNYIGTDASGSLMVSNIYGGVFLADGAIGNTIGSTNAGAGNVISGNLGNGILLRGSSVVNNTIQGNYIGTDATGTNALANAVAGVTVDTGSSSNLIGGTSAGARNVISGNGIPYDYGVIIAGPGTSGNVIEGNYVGVGADGLTAVPNYWGIVCSSGATNNIFGGTSTGARNIISGNLAEGLRLTDLGTMANVVQGNYIGTDSTGEKAVTNDFAGLTIYAGATANLIGGTSAAARNVISGNSSYGINIGNAGTSGNFIEGNYVGLDANGVSAIPNNDGVFFSDSATNNTLGGTAPGAANYVSGNSYRGVFFDGVGTSGNIVEGNYIGTDNTGTNGVGNYYNVEFQNNASGNFIGSVNAGAGNVIAFAGWDGVVLFQAGTTNNSIRGNSIFSNYALGIDLTGVANNLQASPVITNAFGYAAVTVVQGKVDVAANSSFYIDVYRNLAGSQGQFYLGTVNVTTDGSGNASFAYTNTSGNYAGQAITATATSASGDTSQFSAAVTASNVATPSAQFGTAMSWQASGFVFNLTFTTNFTYHIQATTNLSGSPIPWVNLTNFTATSSSLTFTDRAAASFRTRFYRVTSP